jgi:hypothetical protein
VGDQALAVRPDFYGLDVICAFTLRVSSWVVGVTPIRQQRSEEASGNVLLGQSAKNRTPGESIEHAAR